MSNPYDMSVIICTRNRAASLEQTLNSLKKASRGSLQVEIVVVDNGSKDHTPEVIGRFREALDIRLLKEPRLGKGNALNGALDEGGLGTLIAVLDDDITVDRGWFNAVQAISSRWPEHDIFSGHTYPVFPGSELPSWAGNAVIRSWGFSVMPKPSDDKEFKPGWWPLGGHFWFRSQVLDSGIRFQPDWATEPRFVLRLMDMGYRGMSAPDAECGHRLQPELLDPTVMRKRAWLVGREFARVRLLFPKLTRPARLLKERPLLTRLYSVGILAYWMLRFAASWLIPLRDWRDLERILSAERASFFRGVLAYASKARKEWARLERGEI